MARWIDAYPLRAAHAVLLRFTKPRSRKGLYAFLEQHVALVPRGSTVLSVGSGGKVNELLRKYALSNGFEIVQLDIDPARRPDIVADICEADLGEQRFDAVIMSEVLEHVHSPHLAVANVHRALRAGGKLLVTTPFMLPIHEAPVDYYRYTRFGLEFLMRSFADVRVSERNGYVEAIGVMWLRMLQAETAPARIGAMFIVPVVLLGWPITLLLSLLLSSRTATTGYVAVAIK